jgi:hypothetical protein
VRVLGRRRDAADVRRYARVIAGAHRAANVRAQHDAERGEQLRSDSW